MSGRGSGRGAQGPKQGGNNPRRNGRPRRGKDEGTGRSEGSAETPPNPAKDTPPTDEPKEKVNQQQPPQPEKEYSPPAEKDDKEAVEQVAQVAKAIQEAAKLESQHQEIQRIQSYLSALPERLGSREELLKAKDNRPGHAFFKNLDSNLKRNTAFIKKLKMGFNDANTSSILTEVKALNLKRYASEVVDAVVEMKLAPKDVPSATTLCQILHQRYDEFLELLLPKLIVVFQEDNAVAFPRKRSRLRLLFELYMSGVFDDTDVIFNILRDVVAQDRKNDVALWETNYYNLLLLVSFLRYASEPLLGILSTSKKQLLEGNTLVQQFVGAPWCIPAVAQKFTKLYEVYYDVVSLHLIRMHQTLQEFESQNLNLIETKGELGEDRQKVYADKKEAYERLLANVQALADLLDKPMPNLPVDEFKTRLAHNIQVGGTRRPEGEELSVEAIWDDEETQSFYEEFPPLKSLLPSSLLGKERIEASPDLASSADSKPTEPTETRPKRSLGSSQDESKTREPAKDSAGEDTKEILPSPLDVFLTNLPNCVNKDMIDKAASEFSYLSSKTARKRLVSTMFNVPRSSLVLLPYYARLAAILSTVFEKDIGPPLVAMLEEEFDFLMRKKDQVNIESKIKNIRFLGELCKFKLAPPSLLFSCFRKCLDDFSHHHVDIACALLETCGRYLYRTPETHLRCKNLLDVMMRLKNAKVFDPRLDTLIENAYFMCIPPERPTRRVKELTPLQRFIRKLIYEDLNKSNAKTILKTLRTLPWAECEADVMNTLLKVQKGKYININLVAALITGLAPFRDALAVKIVDRLLENVRSGLEQNDFNEQQTCLMNIKLVGELYNYMLFDSGLVFHVLYTLITFGYGVPGLDISKLDSPADCFRIRLVCMLLNTCGHYFDRGTAATKLNRFLLYFQRYILFKTRVPWDIEFTLGETLTTLRPGYQRFTDWQKLAAAIQVAEKEEMLEKAAELAGVADPVEDRGKPEEHDTLPEEPVDLDGSQDSSTDELNVQDSEEESEEQEEEDDELEGPAADAAFNAAFDLEFKKMMSDSLESAKSSRRPQLSDMTLPPILVAQGGVTDYDREQAMPFKLLLKTKGKAAAQPKAMTIAIPKSVSIASQHQKDIEQQRLEKEQLKRMVLAYEEQQDDTPEAFFEEAGRKSVTAVPKGKPKTRKLEQKHLQQIAEIKPYVPVGQRPAVPKASLPPKRATPPPKSAPRRGGKA